MRESSVRDATLLGARLLLGGYMASHASQKLSGHCRGPGLEKAGQTFERNGRAPGREMALAAAGPGRYRLGPALPRRLAVAAAVPSFAEAAR